jgi:hypothetical protein
LKEELEEIKEAIDMELRKGIEIDDMEDEIYGDTDPDKLPKPFKDIKERIRKDKAARNCRSRGCGPKCQGCRPIEATNRTD